VVELIRGLVNLKPHHRGSVVTIGNFDGIHLGHQALLNRLLEKSKALELPSVVITFEPQPNEYFYGDKVPSRLMKLREKLMVIDELGIDRVLCCRFNEQFAQLSAEDFIRVVLLEKLGAAYVLLGDDSHFGAQRQGDIKMLQTVGVQHGFQPEAMPTFEYEGQRVSTTRVREALEVGDLKRAEFLLGRPFGLSGKVAHGKKQGRIIGFPTANIYLRRKSTPIAGVFVVKVRGLGSDPLLGVANVGTRPTLGGTRTLLEVHIFDFDQTIYGEHVFVEFCHKLRDEERYDSFDELKAQIFKDAEQARKFFG